jgi:hypothetical protein
MVIEAYSMLCRTNEREIILMGDSAGGGLHLSIFGTEGAYEEQGNAVGWSSHKMPMKNDEELLKLLTCGPRMLPKDWLNNVKEGKQEDFFTGKAPIHPSEKLPEEFIGLPEGHFGSHQFLVDEFCRAVESGKLPANNVWAAARYNLPGIAAHQSALKEGSMIKVHDLGDPPKGSSFIEIYA